MNTKTASKGAVSTSFKELLVWQKAHELVLHTYQFTRRFPKEEDHGLTSHFRIAATKVAARIAESHKAINGGKKMQLLLDAQNKLDSCQYFIVLSHDLSYGNNKEISILIEEIDLLLREQIKVVRNSMSFNF